MSDPHPVVERLRAAIDAHDLDALVGCFASDVDSRQPCHPARDFRGAAQVRANWSQILGGVPDLRATLVRSTAAGDAIWCEWDWAGTRRDGQPFAMRGVTILTIAHDRIAAVRFFMEPVEQGGVDVARAIGDHLKK